MRVRDNEFGAYVGNLFGCVVGLGLAVYSGVTFLIVLFVVTGAYLAVPRPVRREFWRTVKAREAAKHEAETEHKPNGERPAH